MKTLDEIRNKLSELQVELQLAEVADDDFETIDRLQAQIGALDWVLNNRVEW